MPRPATALRSLRIQRRIHTLILDTIAALILGLAVLAVLIMAGVLRPVCIAGPDPTRVYDASTGDNRT